MDRLSVNEFTTFSWTFDEDVRRYEEAGAAAIGVWRQKLSDYGEEKGVRLLSESSLDVSNLLWAGGFTGSDGRSFRETVDDALEAIRLAAAMQADCLVIYTGPRAGHTRNHARRLTRNALAELLPLAEDLDLTLAVEPMSERCAADWTYLTDLRQTCKLIDEFGSNRLRLVLDTYHFGQNESLLDSLTTLAPYVSVVHLGDAKRKPSGRRFHCEQDRCRLGDGSVPLVAIIEGLRAAGFDGYFDVELIGEEIESIANDELLCHSIKTYERMVCGVDQPNS